MGPLTAPCCDALAVPPGAFSPCALALCSWARGQYLAGWDPGVHPVQSLTETAGNWFKITLPRSDRMGTQNLGLQNEGWGLLADAS